MPDEDSTQMECRKIAELLGDYLDGSLPPHTRELLEWHMDGCAPCVAFLRTYKETIRATGRLPDAPVPAELKQRLLSFIRSQPDASRPRA